MVSTADVQRSQGDAGVFLKSAYIKEVGRACMYIQTTQSNEHLKQHEHHYQNNVLKL